MSEVIKLDWSKNKEYKLLVVSCIHIGSKASDEAALNHYVNRLVKEPNTYGFINGDLIEGKKIDSPHFNPSGLHSRRLNIQKQYEYAAKKLYPARKKLVGIGLGNHDKYLIRDVNSLEVIVTRPLGIALGGYQTYIDFGQGCVGHLWHGYPDLPRGAKDPIQRDANQRAWLKNRMEGLFSAHFHVMGHVHHLLVQPPLTRKVFGFQADGTLGEETLLSGTPGQRVGRRKVLDIPESSRWFMINGTFRHNGCTGWEDYTEVAGFPPVQIGYVEITIRNDVVLNAKPIYL